MNRKILVEYIHQSLEKPVSVEKGPVITISREYGCAGVQLAEQLTAALNEYSGEGSDLWRMVGKEIIEMAAEQLELPSETVEKIIQEKNPGFFFDFVSVFSDHMIPNDFKVKRKVAAIIMSLANTGHVVILGRGGVVLTQNIEKSLHIRLIAPRDIRIQRVMEMHNVGSKEAEHLIDAVQAERTYVRNYYSGEQTNDLHFDLIFNTKRQTNPMMVSTVLELLKARKII